MKWKYQLSISLSFLIYIPLLALVGRSFYYIILRRNVLRIAWGGKIDEDVWGIGQIGAILTWAPLLSKMCSSAFEVVAKQAQQNGTETTMWDLEMNQLPRRRHTE